MRTVFIILLLLLIQDPVKQDSVKVDTIEITVQMDDIQNN